MTNLKLLTKLVDRRDLYDPVTENDMNRLMTSKSSYTGTRTKTGLMTSQSSTTALPAFLESE